MNDWTRGDDWTRGVCTIGRFDKEGAIEGGNAPLKQPNAEKMPNLTFACKDVCE